MPKTGNGATIPEILAALETRNSQIHSRPINLHDFKVLDNTHFEVNGLELYVDQNDTHPIKQLCRQIGMSYGFFKANPSMLNQTIFDTRLRELDGVEREDADGRRERDTGDRIIRYRVFNGRNQLLAILPVVHQVLPYLETLRPIAESLPKDAIIRESNHDHVDAQHRFSLRASFPSFSVNAADHDPIEMGLFLDMSEDGLGNRMNLTSMLYRLICENGAMTTFDNHPYFEYNYRGIRPVDLGSAVATAVGRFGQDLEFAQSRLLESTKTIMSKEEVDSFVRQLENYRDVSAGFLRKVRKELTSRDNNQISRFDLVNEITLQAQTLPHRNRVQHEFLGGRLLGMNLRGEAS